MSTVALTATTRGGSTTGSVTVGGGAVLNGLTVTPQTVGLNGVGLTDADLVPYTGPPDLVTGGTYDRMLITTNLQIDGDPTFTRCKFATSGGDTSSNPGIQIYGNGTGRATFTDCDITSATIVGGVPSQDRAIGVMGNQPFTFERCRIYGTQRGIYFASHGLGASYRRQVLRCMIGDFGGSSGNHTSCVGHGAGGHAYWVDIIGNNMLNSGNYASGCFQLYPEAPGVTPAPGYDAAYWVIDSNLFNTDGGYAMTIGFTSPETPNNHCAITNNWFGVALNPSCGIYGTDADSGNSFAPGNPYYNTWSGNTWHAPGKAIDGTVVGE